MITKNLGALALAAYLIVVGLNHFIAIPAIAVVSAILAIAAGVLTLLGK